MLCFSVLAFQVCRSVHTMSCDSHATSSSPYHQLVTLADMFATSGVSSGGCIALGVFLQLTVVAQFMWILSLVGVVMPLPTLTRDRITNICLYTLTSHTHTTQVVNLWLSLMGLSNGRDPLFAYVLASWGNNLHLTIS